MTSKDTPGRESVPQSLFHYTTAAGLLGIVQKGNLRATDVRFLNDAQEVTYGLRPMYEAIASLENPARNPDHWSYQFEVESQDNGGQYGPTETFERYREGMLEQLSEPSFGVYTTCFCKNGDLLSQWRGYGADHGYSIEFESEELDVALGRLSSAASQLVPVRYGGEASREVIEATVHEIVNFNFNHPGTKAYMMAEFAISRIAALKHPSFREEQEWRIVVTYSKNQQEPPSTYFSHEPSLFRATPMAIVPYIEIPFAVKEGIKSVTVGPGNNADIREAGVRRLLKSVGSTADVHRSSTPLRT